MSQIRFDLGRSDFPYTPPHGGSMTMASVGSAIRAASTAVRVEAAKRAVADQRSQDFGAAIDGVEWRAACAAAATPRRATGAEVIDLVGEAVGAPFWRWAVLPRQPRVLDLALASCTRPAVIAHSNSAKLAWCEIGCLRGRGVGICRWLMKLTSSVRSSSKALTRVRRRRRGFVVELLVQAGPGR